MATDAGSPVARVLGALPGDPKKSGNGYKAKCPAHEDQHASLTIGTGQDGRVLLNCHAGCPTENILSALGLSMTDLFEKSSAGNPVRRFHLVDRGGHTVAIHGREDTGTGKQMWWESSNGKKGLNGTALESLPLYRLPDLLAADPTAQVIVCEGEKAADALADIGVLAVGTVTGAGSAPSVETLAPLQGHVVALWPDNDAPGRQHMQRVAARLDTPPMWVDWKDAPAKGDAADYVASDGTADGVREMLVTNKARQPGPHLSVVRMSEVQPEPIEWLWRGRLARGKPTLLMGDPGLGKSLITHTVAAITSVGGEWPDGGRSEKGAAILFTIEDGLSDTVSPRLRAANADLQHVIAVRGVLEDDASMAERMFALTEHLSLLEQLIVEENAVYVVMDPITAYLGQDVNSHREADVRAVLGPLSMLAERTGIALVMVMHLNKGSGVSALYRATGSIAFPAVARVVLGVAPDPNDDDAKRKLLLPVKMNIGKLPEGIGYRIETSTKGVLTRASEEDQPPVLIWDNDPVEVDAAGAMDRNGTPQELGAVAETKRVLNQILAEGRVTAKKCKDEIRESVGTTSETVMSRARKELGVLVRKEGYGSGSVWWWELPSRARARVSPKDSSIAFDSLTSLSHDTDSVLANPQTLSKTIEESKGYQRLRARAREENGQAEESTEVAAYGRCRVCGGELQAGLERIGLHYDCVEEARGR